MSLWISLKWSQVLSYHDTSNYSKSPSYIFSSHLLCTSVACIINPLDVCFIRVFPARMQIQSEKMYLPFHCLSLCYVYSMASAYNVFIFYPLPVHVLYAPFWDLFIFTFSMKIFLRFSSAPFVVESNHMNVPSLLSCKLLDVKELLLFIVDITSSQKCTGFNRASMISAGKKKTDMREEDRNNIIDHYKMQNKGSILWG